MNSKSFITYRINTAECETTLPCAPFVARKMSKLPGFDQHLPAKCLVFPYRLGTEHYQPLELFNQRRIALSEGGSFLY
jgi:hypothetical protein